MPEGSCVKARPRGAHQQDSHSGLATSEGKRAYQASLSAGGPRSQALYVPGDRRCTRVPDEGWRWQVDRVVATCPHAPRASLRSQGKSSGLALAGLYAAIGTPWKASHGRGGLAGRRSSGAAPLACDWPLQFSVLGRPRTVISACSCVKARPRCARCCAALTPARSDWASPRKDGKHKLQRPAAQRPGERRACCYPTPS
jgi:hypothetical protein